MNSQESGRRQVGGCLGLALTLGRRPTRFPWMPPNPHLASRLVWSHLATYCCAQTLHGPQPCRSPFGDQGASWADLEEVYDLMAEAGELPLRWGSWI